ncbi:hypothetical protein [Albidovulum sp.]|uniref:hypothetical protein n=1 Tax=Albidovulum sp. TaxID=1872424 RepID=UPI0039B9722F
MKPVVLLVGKLPGIVGHLADELEDLPIRWLGAHDHGEVIYQLEHEQGIALVIMGAGLDDGIRGDLVGVIAAVRPDVTIHLKDRASGPGGMAAFVRRVVTGMLLNDT